MTTVANYLGRTVDVCAFAGQDPNRETLLIQALALPGQGGAICTGMQKLAQRWLMEFLTMTGSMKYLPQRGCDFMAQLSRGQLRTTRDVEQAFYLAAAQVKLNLRTEDPVGAPDDEVLADAELLNLAINGDQLIMHLSLSSLAGTARTVILPLATTVS